MTSCKNEEAMDAFLRDIATLSELQAMSERLEVAKLLSQGLSYRQIAQQTGASTTTVTRVAHFLENGAGGYRDILKTHRHHRIKTDMLPVKEMELKEGETSIIKPATPLQKYLGRAPTEGKK